MLHYIFPYWIKSQTFDAFILLLFYLPSYRIEPDSQYLVEIYTDQNAECVDATQGPSQAEKFTTFQENGKYPMNFSGAFGLITVFDGSYLTA